MSAAWCRETPAGIELRLKVQPRASRNEIAGLAGDELRLRVTAPPVDSAANEAVVRFVAETLGVSRGAVTLLRGAASRHKVLLIRGLALAAVRGGLGQNAA
jgi:uncharacterized protein (TIGR00251 family)